VPFGPIKGGYPLNVRDLNPMMVKLMEKDTWNGLRGIWLKAIKSYLALIVTRFVVQYSMREAAIYRNSAPEMF